jgi:hypothetical protein
MSSRRQTRPVAAVGVGDLPHHQVRVERDAVQGQRLAIPAQASPDGGDLAPLHHEGDPAVSVLEEFGHRRARARDLVGDDVGNRARVRDGVDQHHGEATAELGHGDDPVVEGGVEDPVDAPVQQRPQRVLLELGIAGRLDQDQHHAGAPRHVLGALDHPTGIWRRRHPVADEPDRLGSLCPQPSGERVGFVLGDVLDEGTVVHGGPSCDWLLKRFGSP